MFPLLLLILLLLLYFHNMHNTDTGMPNT